MTTIIEDSKMVEEVKEVEAFQKLLTYKIVVGRGDGRPKAFDTTERAADHLSVSVDLNTKGACHVNTTRAGGR